MTARTIGFVTSARADFGLLKGVMAAVDADPALRLIVYPTGMHHSAEHGNTIDEVRSAGFTTHLVEVPVPPTGDTAADVAAAIGRGVTAFAETFADARPDILVILGDRFDSYPAALAALPFNIPVAHISGGELTEGAIDDAIRHSFTKLSHLHFATTEDHAGRIRQLGEEPWRVIVSGQPGLDEIKTLAPRPKPEVFSDLDLDPNRPTSLLTYHPETLDPASTAPTIAAILDAARTVDTQILITAPNADTGHRAIRQAIEPFCASQPGTVFRESLGHGPYLEMLACADCMVGNSSSGLIEAASFRLPVVNIGSRQARRLAPPNVISVDATRDAIATAWTKALTDAFRATLENLTNPYGDGHAIARIVDRLKSTDLGPRLLHKTFVDQP